MAEDRLKIMESDDELYITQMMMKLMHAIFLFRHRSHQPPVTLLGLEVPYIRCKQTYIASILECSVFSSLPSYIYIYIYMYACMYVSDR
jgi:hypothetical protein